MSRFPRALALLPAFLLLTSAPATAADPQPLAGVEAAPQQRPRLLLAQPFTVASPWPHSWHAARAPVTEGLVLVVEVDPADALPRQVGGRVLYVGDTPAERITWAADATRMVVVAPGPVDLATIPVFWGPDTLPELVTADVGAAVLAGHGGELAPATERDAARAAGEAPWVVQDRTDLDVRLAPLVRTWVPQDAARVQGWD